MHGKVKPNMNGVTMVPLLKVFSCFLCNGACYASSHELGSQSWAYIEALCSRGYNQIS